LYGAERTIPHATSKRGRERGRNGRVEMGWKGNGDSAYPGKGWARGRHRRTTASRDLGSFLTCGEGEKGNLAKRIFLSRAEETERGLYTRPKAIKVRW